MLNTGVKHDLEEFKVAQNSRSTKIENKHLSSSENLKAVSNRLDEAMTLIKKLELELKNTTDILDITEKNLREKIAVSNRSNVNTKAINFHYGLSNTQTSSGIIKFDRLLSTSSENGYNPSSGKFIVPEDGVYYFFLHYYILVSSSFSRIYVDGTTKARTGSDSASQLSIACSLIINLQKNQEVYVKLESGKMYGHSSDPLTYFQGLKIA